MAIRLHWIGNVSLAFGLVAAASTGYAQSPRAWIDPPPEAGTSHAGSSPPAAGAPKPAAPQPSLPATDVNAAAKADAVSKKQVLQRTSETSSSTDEDKSISKPQPRKIATESKDRKQQTRTAVRSEPPARSRKVAERASGPSRAEIVRQGVNSGLEVMTLRTIEFPDGRRVQILTRPRPEAMSGLMEAPE